MSAVALNATVNLGRRRGFRRFGSPSARVNNGA
jgi:hypothetical protein